MKYILFFSILFVSVANGQTAFPSGILISGDDRELGTMDTVAASFLVEDTLVYANGAMFNNRPMAFSIRGYMVYRWESDQWNEQHFWVLKQYLNSNKKPLKNYFIWIAKPLK